MKKLTVLLLFFFAATLFSQNVLKGKITDKDNKPLEGVNVYFDGTTIATVTDENGLFKIKSESNTNNILVISSVGYQTEYLSSLDVSKELNVILKVAENQLKEVVVSNKELFTRDQKLKVFRECFIGKTKNSKGAVIQNENDIHFRYDKEKLLLTAYANKPIVIINSSLGYKIDFELVAFEAGFNRLSINPLDVIKNYFGGVSKFEEINNSPAILKRREKTYQGSQLHFFRNLANNIWEKNGFLLISEKHILDPAKCFKLTPEEGFVNVEILLKFEKELFDPNIGKIVTSYDILYDRNQQSKITFQTDNFKIYRFGNNSNIDKIIFSGKMGQEKVGDMLPLNYKM